MRQNLNSVKGVTLIELIMAMVIMVAISIPTAYMISAQIQGVVVASDLTAAGNAERLAMEKLSNTPYAAITTGVSLPANSLVVGSYTVNWDVVETVNGGAAKKDITMTVRRTGTSSVLLTLYNTFCSGVSNGA